MFPALELPFSIDLTGLQLPYKLTWEVTATLIVADDTYIFLLYNKYEWILN